tara:strand:+ start:9 stop:167 length:159 start_codon:yes stop_codon:yes gene_type:complete
MTELFSSPIFWCAVALASEIIGSNPKLKSNSVIQLVFETLQKMKTKVNDNPK